MKKIFILLLIVFAVNIFATAGTSPALTYKQLLFIHSATNSGFTTTYKPIYDGDGGVSPIQMKLTGLMFNTTNELIFRDAGLGLYSSADGKLNLFADTEFIVTAPTFDIDASSGVDISHDLVINGTTASTSPTSGSVIIDGGVGIADDLFIGVDLDVDGTSNIDDIDIDGAFKFDGTTFDVNATDDIDIDTSDTTGGLALATATSGVPISIGHTTSETTVNDNLTVTGTLTQSGTSAFTGTVTVDGLTATGTSTLATVDINAGAIDGATIGATSATTGKFTTLETTSTTSIGGRVDLVGNILGLDADKDTTIRADTDDVIAFKVATNDELIITATAVYPSDDSGLSLGLDASREFLSIYANDEISAGDDLIAGDDVIVGDDATISGDCNVAGAITADAMSMIVAFNYGNDDGGDDTYAITLNPALSSYVTGTMIILDVATNNTGASTLDVNGRGAKNIKTVSGGDPANSDILATGIAILVYNGTNFVLINPATTCD